MIPKKLKSLFWALILIPVSFNAWAKDDLTFKILEQKAVQFESSLTQNLNTALKRYIPRERFNLVVRVYWNRGKIDEMKLTRTKKPLQKKQGKLPGFDIFVRDEEQSLEYYWGSGSIMRLKVTILLDNKLPDEYRDFIENFIPIQARFVPERGDSVKIIPTSFPETKAWTKEEYVPLVQDEAAKAVVDSLSKSQKELDKYKPVLIHPVLRKYISEYEKYITGKLDKILRRYMEKEDFVLNVNFNWNQNEVKRLRNLVMKADTDGKVKLPGFTIYLEEKDSIYEVISNSTSLMSLEVNILLDDAVSKEVDPFLQQVIPLSFKFIPERGDELNIFRGSFPESVLASVEEKKAEEVEAKEAAKLVQARKIVTFSRLRNKLKDHFIKGNFNKAEEQIKNFLESAKVKRSEKIYLRRKLTFIQDRAKINNFFSSGNYNSGLRVIDSKLPATQDKEERFALYKMQGSLFFMKKDRTKAKTAWTKAIKLHPKDQEINSILTALRQ